MFLTPRLGDIERKKLQAYFINTSSNLIRYRQGIANKYYTPTGDVKLTESNAIIRYIARKHGLDGKTEMERVRIDMIENLSLATYMEFARVAYSPDFVSCSLHRDDAKRIISKDAMSNQIGKWSFLSLWSIFIKSADIFVRYKFLANENFTCADVA